MAETDRPAEKNVAAQHHDEQAKEHDKANHKLDAEHDEPNMPAHKRETDRLHREQDAQS
jgi:hypothetical protein